jgi:hypothetical protein
MATGAASFTSTLHVIVAAAVQSPVKVSALPVNEYSCANVTRPTATPAVRSFVIAVWLAPDGKTSSSPAAGIPAGDQLLGSDHEPLRVPVQERVAATPDSTRQSDAAIHKATIRRRKVGFLSGMVIDDTCQRLRTSCDSLLRKLATFALFPQPAIEHHLRCPERELSTNSVAQPSPEHRRMRPLVSQPRS